eukprot:240266-Hanusia_phi.AAC.1
MRSRSTARSTRAGGLEETSWCLLCPPREASDWPLIQHVWLRTHRVRLRQLEQAPTSSSSPQLPTRPQPPASRKSRSLTARKRTVKTRSVLRSDQAEVTSPVLKERRLPPLKGGEEELVQRLSVPKKRSNIDMANVVFLGGAGKGAGAGAGAGARPRLHWV